MNQASPAAPTRALHVVTGALGYSGRAMTERLLAAGIPVRTLTNSPGRPNPFGAALDIRPLAFDRPRELVESLRGADVLINTYWVRFNHRLFGFESAVANTKVLFDAAREAGVRRVVHVSILKPEEGRGLEYYEGKLELERALARTGVAHTILRPGVLFGRGDILVNNIAWAVRRLPVFGVFGDGAYRLAPLHVDDFAAIACDAAASGAPAEVIDCHGPETYTYEELARMIAAEIGRRARIVRVPPVVGHAVGAVLGKLVGDVVITRQEIEGLMRGLLFSERASRGSIGLRGWVREHRLVLGTKYASEVGRRVRRDRAYADA